MIRNVLLTFKTVLYFFRFEHQLPNLRTRTESLKRSNPNHGVFKFLHKLDQLQSHLSKQIVPQK